MTSLTPVLRGRGNEGEEARGTSLEITPHPRPLSPQRGARGEKRCDVCAVRYILVGALTLFLKSTQQAEKVGAFLFDLRGRAGVMKGDNLEQNRVELLPGPGIFVMEHCRFALPATGDFANPQPFVKMKMQQLHPATRCRTAPFGALCHQARRFAKQRLSPGAVKGPRESFFIILDLIQVGFIGYLAFPPPRTGFFKSERNVTDHAVEEGSETARSPTLGAIQDASLLEALDEHFLNCIVEVLETRRGTPARSKAIANHRAIAAREILAALRCSRRRGFDDRPTSDLGLSHASGHEEGLATDPPGADATRLAIFLFSTVSLFAVRERLPKPCLLTFLERILLTVNSLRRFPGNSRKSH